MKTIEIITRTQEDVDKVRDYMGKGYDCYWIGHETGEYYETTLKHLVKYGSVWKIEVPEEKVFFVCEIETYFKYYKVNADSEEKALVRYKIDGELVDTSYDHKQQVAEYDV